MTVWWWAAFFNLEPPLRITRKVERPKLYQRQSFWLWWKESSPWEDWFVTWQAERISTEKKKIFFLVWFLISHVQFLCGIWSQVLCCPISIVTGATPERIVQRTFTFLTKRIAAVLRFRTTRVRVPLARNPSPLQYPTSHVLEHSVRSLLRQPRSALEAGPSEAHAISFVHTPRPHLHQQRCAFLVSALLKE